MVSRRRFLSSASLLLGGVGVSALVKNDLLKKLSRELFPEAHADAPNQPVDFFIELCGRDGAPVIYLGTGREFSVAGANRFPNVPVDQVSDLVAVGGNNGARQIFMNNVAGGTNSVAALLGPHADNIAISQGLSAQGLPHSGLFGHREGIKEMGLTTPIVESADRAKRNGAYGALVVHGVNFNRGNSVMNQTNGLQDLVDVNGTQAFRNLFREPVLRLTRNEVQAVSEASKSLSKIQAQILSRRISNAYQVAESQNKGADLLTRDFTQLVNTASMDSNFMIGQNFQNMGRNWGDIGGALAHACKGFENGLISTATITYQSGDWHGFQALSNQSYQANAGVYMARVLSSTIAFLKATPHPFRAGESLWDRTLIQMSSEFTRGISAVNSDNNDGGTTGFALMGGKIKGGYYGSFDLSGGGGGRAYGFDPATGESQIGRAPLSTGTLYNTVNHLLGNSQKVTAQPVLSCLVRT